MTNSDSTLAAVAPRRASWVSLLLGRRQVAPVGRGQCHRLLLDLKGVGARQVGSSIGLQLRHLTGKPQLGYAWQLDGTQADVWYWDEAGVAPSEDSLPCPEMLLRPTLPDGVQLLRCAQGLEAVYWAQGKLLRTRWFASMPDASAWAAFVQDAGLDPAAHPVPVVHTPALGATRQAGWRIQTAAVRPMTWRQWAAVAGIALGGAALVAALTYQFRLDQSLSRLRDERDALLGQSSTAIKLQQQIDAQRAQLDLVASVQPKVLQLRLMAALADAGMFGEDTKVTLQEWEYRNGRMRLQFAVPIDDFSLTEFLEDIEDLDLFTDVKLVSGTPPQVVAIQAGLKSNVAATLAATAPKVAP